MNIGKLPPFRFSDPSVERAFDRIMCLAEPLPSRSAMFMHVGRLALQSVLVFQSVFTYQRPESVREERWIAVVTLTVACSLTQWLVLGGLTAIWVRLPLSSRMLRMWPHL